MVARRGKKNEKVQRRNGVDGGRILSVDSARPGGRYQWIIFFLVAFALLAVWYGPYLASSRIGIFDTNKDIYYFEYFRTHIKAGQFPFFFMVPPPSISWYPALNVSHAAFANPEVYVFSPDMVLMYFLPTVAFIKTHFALHLIVGALGVYLLSRRLGLRLEFGLGLLLLVLLNPWYMQHIAIGYFPWINAALFPLIAALLIPRPKGRYDICWAGLINALILYQGGLHLFLWFNGTALLVALMVGLRHKSIKPLVRMVLFYGVTIFAGLPKLLMTAGIWGGMEQEIFRSYGSLGELYWVLTDCTTNPHVVGGTEEAYIGAWYDSSLYMGGYFLGLIVISVAVAEYKQRWKIFLDVMLIPAVIVAVVSWGDNWQAVVGAFEGVTKAILGKAIGILQAEKYPWRFLFISILLFSTFAMSQLSQFVSGIKRRTVRIGVSGVFCVGLALTGMDLFLRNQDFSLVARGRASEQLFSYSIREAMSDAPLYDAQRRQAFRVGAVGYIGPNRIEIPARCYDGTEGMVLPWLKRSDAALFRAENCEIEAMEMPEHRVEAIAERHAVWLGEARLATVLKIKDRSKKVVLTYDRRAFYRYLAIGALGVAVAFGVAYGVGRKRSKGLAGSEPTGNR